jgi:predicted signal transduction protein with EAL and GGDEF domain
VQLDPWQRFVEDDLQARLIEARHLLAVARDDHRFFVVDLDSDDGALAIARAIVALAGALGLRVVAEGVESAAHARRLRELGCDELQGYFFAKPMPAEELPAFLNTQPVRAEEAHAMALGS